MIMNQKTIKKISILFFLLFSFYLTLNFLGIENLYFNNIDWLLGGGDIANAQNGWTFFKNDKWHFPIGKNPNYGLEVSNSIIFSDSIPLFAFIFKIFKNFLSVNFQYFSLWIFVCFFLQLYLSYLIIYKISQNLSFAMISSLIFVLAPILIYRISFHLSLGAHWLILLGFYINFENDENKKTFYWIFILILSTLVHLYITVMLFGIYSAYLLQKFLERKNFIEPISKLIIVIFIILFFMYIFGYFEASVMGAVSRGYGYFKLDLLSIIDPKVAIGGNWSNFLPNIQGTTLEGFNYIGLGNFLIIIIALLIFSKKSLVERNYFKNSIKKNAGYLIVMILFTLWSLTTRLTFAGNEILNLSLHKYFVGALSIFASTGRFFWPVYYLLIIFSLIMIFNNFKIKHALYILIFSLTLQIVDTYPGLKFYFIERNQFSEPNKLNDEIWKSIPKNYDKIRTTYLFNNYGPMFSDLSHFLGTNKIKKTDIVVSASLDRAKAAQARYNFNNFLYNKKIPPDTAYIVDNLGYLKLMKKLLKDTNIGFFYRDKFWLALPGKKNEMTLLDKQNFENVKFDEIKLNQNYELNFNSQDRNTLLGVGWSHNHGIEAMGKGIWSEGDVSFLLFGVKDYENKDLEIKLNLSKYKSNKNKNFRVQIFLNNELKQEINLNKYENNDNVILDLQQNELNSENILMFKFYDLISPLDIFESPDARKLGILLKTISLESK